MSNKDFLVAGLAVVLIAATSSPAHATLIGDTLSVEYHYPELGTIFESHLTVVQAGTADTVQFFAGVPHVNVNVEASSVQIDWIIDPIDFNSGNFNGIVITDLDFTPFATLIGLSIVTNAMGWNDSFASFTADSIAINYAALGSVPQFSMTVELLTSPVPVPASLGLLVSGLAALGFLRRRRI